MSNLHTSTSELHEHGRYAVELGGATLVHEGHPERNEDQLLVVPELQLIAAFDGVGGHKGSEVASRLAAERVHQYLATAPDVMQAAVAENMLGTALLSAHYAVLEHGEGKLGTTAAVAKVFKDESGLPYAAFANVADSRIYLFRNGKLNHLSYDKGRQYTEASAKTINTQQKLADIATRDELWQASLSIQDSFYYRNLITSMIGQPGSEPIITTHSISLKHGDVLLTTSDGIHDNLTHDEITAIIASAQGPDDVTQRLTAASRERSRDANHIRAKPDDMTAAALYFTM